MHQENICQPKSSSEVGWFCFFFFTKIAHIQRKYCMDFFTWQVILSIDRVKLVLFPITFCQRIYIYIYTFIYTPSCHLALTPGFTPSPDLFLFDPTADTVLPVLFSFSEAELGTPLVGPSLLLMGSVSRGGLEPGPFCLLLFESGPPFSRAFLASFSRFRFSSSRAFPIEV